MSFPTFSDFMLSLDAEKIGAKMALVSRPEIIKTEGTGFSEKEIEMFEKLYRKAVRSSYEIFIIYLEEYHKWISEYLS